MTALFHRQFGESNQKKWAPADRSGLLPGTIVETTGGFRAVEDLDIGMEIFTLDDGIARVIDLEHPPVRAAGGRAVTVSPGALGNDAEFCLPVTQLVLIETRSHAAVVGAPLALVSVGDLVGLEGFAPAPLACEALVTPVFETEELIYAQSGTLLFCPGLSTGGVAEFYPVLEQSYARRLLSAPLSRSCTDRPQRGRPA